MNLCGFCYLTEKDIRNFLKKIKPDKICQIFNENLLIFLRRTDIIRATDKSTSNKKGVLE